MRQRRRSYIYPLVILVILMIMGTIHLFEKPHVSSQPIKKVAPPPTVERTPAQKINDTEEGRYASPLVLGDENFIDVDPSDSKGLQDIINDAKPGTTIRLSDGEYKTGPFRISKSGTAKNWIKIIAAEDGKPKIDLLGEGDFHIGASYIYLEGIEIFNGQKSNVRIASTTHTLSHIYLKRMKLRALQNGPGSSLKIQRNNANGVGVSSIFVEDSDLSQSYPASVIDGIGANTVAIRNNFIHTDSGYAAGITFKGGSSRILIENNFIKGVRKNPAIVMGGRTFLNFFDPQYPDQEGVDQVARNNIIVDFDESAVNFQGVKNAKFLHNTIVTSSTGPIFHFEEGNTNDGSKPSKNQSISIENNLIISRAPSTSHASNISGLIPSLRFGKQMWIGVFTNPTEGRTSIPTFPISTDVILPSQKAFIALEGLQWKDVMDLEMARVRFSPREKGPIPRSTASITEVPADFLGRARENETSFGALEK
jgi:hypothetical protein